MNLEGWQKPYVQRVLDFHNKKYGTNIAIIGHCEKIYPELKGRPNWDWSARDKNNGGEIAIEVKRLTNRQLQERYSAFQQVCHELSEELSGKLRGTFLLFVEISEKQRFNLEGAKKQQLRETLKKLIFREAQRLEVRKEQSLTQALRGRLPDILPQDCYCNLYKFDDEGSYLSPNVGVVWSAPSAEPRDCNGLRCLHLCRL